MLIKILNFFRGYISVKADGGFSERLINICTLKGIPMWEISYVKNDMFFFTRAEYYKQLKNAAKSSGMNIKVHGRFGLPFLINKNRDRTALAVGIVLIFCFIAFMSTRVWSVCVTGNENVFDSEIIAEFEKLGVKAGARKKSIDIQEVQKRFLSDLGDKIIWVSLNLEGMCAEIQVRETKASEPMTDGKPCNIVAAFDGTLMSIKTYSGTPTESVKNGVKEGDLLISGIVEYYDGTLDFVEARGEIAAEHTVNLKCDLKAVEERNYISDKTAISVSAFALELPLMRPDKNESSELTEREKFAVLNNVRLPFTVTKVVQSFYRTESAEATIRRKYLIARYLNVFEDKTKNSDVISVSSHISGKGKDIKIAGEIDCVDFIGKSVPINIKTE